MAKFYVKSGNVSLVISACDAKGAAQQALQRTVNQYFPIDDIEIRLLNSLSLDWVLLGLSELDLWIAISQIGMGRSEAGLFNRDELFTTWRTNVYSITYLFDQLPS